MNGLGKDPEDLYELTGMTNPSKKPPVAGEKEMSFFFRK
jgi:hypothetical protein